MSETARTNFIEADGVRVYPWPPAIEPPSKAGQNMMTMLALARMGDPLNDLAVMMPMEVRVAANILRWKAPYVFHANIKRAKELFIRNRGLLYTLGIFGPTGVHSFERFAKRAMNGRDRDILGICGFPAENALVRLLAKTQIDVHNKVYLQMLVDYWRRDSWARRILPHLPNITGDVLQLLRYGDRAGPNLLFAAGQSDLGYSNVTYNFKILDSLWRETGETHWPYRGLTLDQLHSAINRLTLYKLRGLYYPDPPVPGTEEIRPIRTPQELYREGKKQRNCAFTLDATVRDGANYVYKFEGEAGRATIALVNKERYWALGELRCFDNANPPRQLVKQVIWWLEHEQPNISRDELDVRFRELVDPPETPWDEEPWA